MKKFKRAVCGILSTLTLLGLLKGSSKVEKKNSEEINTPPAIETPIEESEVQKNALESILKHKIEEFNNRNNNKMYIEYKAGLIIYDIDNTEVDYEQLNEIIDLYSKLDDTFTSINYYPYNFYNINFNYVNLQDLGFYLVVYSYQIKLENITPAIQKSLLSSLIISKLEETNTNNLIELMEMVSNKNGNISFVMDTKDYNQKAIDILINNINKRNSHFNNLSIISNNPFSLLVSQVNADEINLHINTNADTDNISYKIKEGTKRLSIWLEKEEMGTMNKNVTLEIPDSLEELYVDYSYIDTLRIKDIKNAYFSMSSFGNFDLKKFIELGYFNYPKFMIKDRITGYIYKRDESTNNNIEVWWNNSRYIGNLLIKIDKKGDILNLFLISPKEEKVLPLSRKRTLKIR